MGDINKLSLNDATANVRKDDGKRPLTEAEVKAQRAREAGRAAGARESQHARNEALAATVAELTTSQPEVFARASGELSADMKMVAIDKFASIPLGARDPRPLGETGAGVTLLAHFATDEAKTWNLGGFLETAGRPEHEENKGDALEHLGVVRDSLLLRDHHALGLKDKATLQKNPVWKQVSQPALKAYFKEIGTKLYEGVLQVPSAATSKQVSTPKMQVTDAVVAQMQATKPNNGKAPRVEGDAGPALGQAQGAKDFLFSDADLKKLQDTIRVAVEGSDIDFSKMDIDEAIQGVMYQISEQAEIELRDLMKDMQARIKEKRVKRAEIQARKEQMNRADALLNDEYNKLQAGKLISPTLSFEQFKAQCKVSYGEPRIDKDTGDVIAGGVALAEPIWSNEPNAIPESLRPGATGANKTEGPGAPHVDAKTGAQIIEPQLSTYLHYEYDNDKTSPKPSFEDWVLKTYKVDLNKADGKDMTGALQDAIGDKNYAEFAKLRDAAGVPFVEFRMALLETPPNADKINAARNKWESAMTAARAFAESHYLGKHADKMKSEVSGGYKKWDEDLNDFAKTLKAPASTIAAFASATLETHGYLNMKGWKYPGVPKAPDGYKPEGTRPKKEEGGTLPVYMTDADRVTDANGFEVSKTYGLPVGVLGLMGQLYNAAVSKWPGTAPSFDEWLAGALKGKKGADAAKELTGFLEKNAGFIKDAGADYIVKQLHDQLDPFLAGKAAPKNEEAPTTPTGVTPIGPLSDAQPASLPAQITATAQATYNACKGPNDPDFATWLQQFKGNPQQVGDALLKKLTEMAKGKGDNANAFLGQFRDQLKAFVDGKFNPTSAGVREQKAVPGHENCTTTAAMQTKIDKAKDELDTMGDMGELEQLKLQRLTDRRAKALETITNLMKKTAQTKDKIIENLK